MWPAREVQGWTWRAPHGAGAGRGSSRHLASLSPDSQMGLNNQVQRAPCAPWEGPPLSWETTTGPSADPGLLPGSRPTHKELQREVGPEQAGAAPRGSPGVPAEALQPPAARLRLHHLPPKPQGADARSALQTMPLLDKTTGWHPFPVPGAFCSEFLLHGEALTAGLRPLAGAARGAWGGAGPQARQPCPGGRFVAGASRSAGSSLPEPRGQTGGDPAQTRAGPRVSAHPRRGVAAPDRRRAVRNSSVPPPCHHHMPGAVKGRSGLSPPNRATPTLAGHEGDPGTGLAEEVTP